MRIFVFTLAAAVGCLGQTTKVLRLTQGQSARDLEEISVVLRSVAGISQQSLDDSLRTLTVNGTDSQVGVASWLVQQLDLPAAAASAGVHEYRPPASDDDVVRVFYLQHAPRPQDLQEIVTAIRSVADVQRLFVCNRLKAIIARASNQRIALSAWMVDQLDLPADAQAPEPHEFKLAENDVARIFDLVNPQDTKDLQEISTLVRNVADVQRLFIYRQRRALAARSTTERIALAAWLVNELDRPADAAAAGAAGHEFRLTNDPENVVRVFYFAKPESREALGKVLNQVRESTGTRRLFPYDPLGALAVRGSAEQLAAAEKVIASLQEK